MGRDQDVKREERRPRQRDKERDGWKVDKISLINHSFLHNSSSLYKLP